MPHIMDTEHYNAVTISMTPAG